MLLTTVSPSHELSDAGSQSPLCVLVFCNVYAAVSGLQYGDGAFQTVDENSSIFSLIRMH